MDKVQGLGNSELPIGRPMYTPSTMEEMMALIEDPNIAPLQIIFTESVAKDIVTRVKALEEAVSKLAELAMGPRGY